VKAEAARAAGGEIVAWAPANGLARFRCKGCGRTFNALTKAPMARLRKKDRWLDRAQAMIEGKSLVKTPNFAASTRAQPFAGGIGFSAGPRWTSPER
jgi:hypothetical protein